MKIDTSVFDGPGLPLLLELEQGGLDLAVRGGELWVRPFDHLTPEQRGAIHRYRAELITLVRCCDDGVQRRLEVYRAQIEVAPDTRGPFLYVAGVAYVRGICFSCAARLPAPAFGRCWRCSLAWRMAASVPIPAERAAVYDGARVVA